MTQNSPFLSPFWSTHLSWLWETFLWRCINYWRLHTAKDGSQKAINCDLADSRWDNTKLSRIYTNLSRWVATWACFWASQSTRCLTSSCPDWPGRWHMPSSTDEQIKTDTYPLAYAKLNNWTNKEIPTILRFAEWIYFCYCKEKNTEKSTFTHSGFLEFFPDFLMNCLKITTHYPNFHDHWRSFFSQQFFFSQTKDK